MAQLIADQKEIEFILYEQFNAEELLTYKKYKGFSKKIFGMIISEARKVAIKEILPTLRDGDKQGVRFENGKVMVPDSFHRARKVLRESDLTSTMEDPEWGGQGLPFLISIAILDYIVGANYSLSGYINMGHGTGKMIELFGTDTLKKMFVENLYTSRWSGTMLLTESEAGTEVGAITTTARKNDDNTYSIIGNKIFITAGEHDLADNIIHPVLARIEGAPKGSRGISIFIVPKIWVNKDKTLGKHNDIQCVGIEEKMGFHGSATCAMALGSKGECRGFLLGEENKGLEIMFHMMNEARLSVGFQGSTTASLAYLYALDYARHRVQGKDLAESRNPEAESIPIIRHPDVRRMLTWMKAHVDGMRSLVYYVSLCFDKKENAFDETQRELAGDMIELLTPVIKSCCAERGFEVCVQAVQVFGGYGYTKEFPVEQLVRDVKIASIYEGTDGIQAMDFLVRKLGMKKGLVFKGLLDEMGKTIKDAKKIESLEFMSDSLARAVEALGITALSIGGAAMSEKYASAFAHAHPFLEATGDVVMGWMHLWRALTAVNALKKNTGQKNQAFYKGIVTCARFYMEAVLPVTMGRMASVQALSDAALAMDEASFD
ncbi:MAG: acyl-CoA dehydrogenase [Desulfobacula sp.]|uniref:acyl-CoA dehydrogenase n=1 Tax=Desulfobacula sp. TaxID=2593537 RepID=UPI001EC166CD|nr:acyl-CoA dehydrogenase [Desulfobacula sp.]MBT4876251.1 acyl-CoA dehydrogenase [Desulfobacula sp.]MBT7631324.1 acyl-CoA dehydrogenase [Desulfobacula sp.]